VDETCAILLIEDDGAIRGLLADALAETGWEVRSAASGRQALAILDHWRPDLILLDLEMPEMDGPAFRAEQRRRPALASIPVVVISAAPRLDERVATLGAAATLPKPCDLDILAAVIKQVLEGEGARPGELPPDP
jgi:DNA-binding response OmpR family regulator